MAAAAPAKNFIRFLSSYGPYGSSKAQFDEHVRENARDNGVEPFTFTLSKQDKYKQLIGNCLQEHKSKVFLIAGQAGDGKTHFLRDICSDESLFNLSDSTWDTVIDATHESLTIDEQGNVAEFHKPDNTETDVTFGIQSLSIPNKGSTLRTRLYLITDLSELDNNEDKATLFKTIEDISKMVNAPQAAESENIILLIAGNNGRILSIFSEYESLGEYFTPSSDADVRESIAKLQSTLEHHMILNKQFHCNFMELLPMSDCLNRDAVTTIFREVLNSEYWNLCKDCEDRNLCPILANRNALNQENVVRHFADLFELAKDDGMHFTVRNLMVVITNAILGAQNNKSSRRYFTCTGAHKLITCNFDEANAWANDRRSSPYDNLLGLNLQDKMFNSSFDDDGENSTKNLINSPIYVHLDSFGIGAHSNKLIDNFIIYGCTEENTENVTSLKETVIGHDAAASRIKLKACLDALQTGTDDSNGDVTKRMKSLVASLRRVIFFTADEDLDSASLNKAGFSTYALTNLKYAKHYLKLKEIINRTFDLNNEHEIKSTIRQLLDGLNRAFTSLPVLNSDWNVYISSNNRINPAAFCIIPNEHRFKVPFSGDKSKFDDVIKIVSSSVLNDVKCQPTLVYYASEDNKALVDSEQDATKGLSDSLEQEFIDSILMLFEEDMSLMRYAMNAMIKKNVQLNQFSVSEKLKFYLNYLKEKDTFTDVEKERLDKLQSCFSTANDADENAIKYPNGVHPVVGAKLTLSPRVFDYLMSLGAGVNGISFTNESYAELSAFKARIDAIKVRSFNQEEASPGSNSGISNLKFCSIADAGTIKFN